jgi:hypothetical protein
MFTVTVTPDGGEPFDVEITSRDGLKWERARKGRSISQFTENPSLEAMYSLTYVAVQRDGRFTGDIREFEEQCDIDKHPESEDEAEGENPTPSGR